MNWRTIAFIILMALCWSSVPSNAAEISCSQLYTGDEKLEPFEVKIDWGKGRVPTPYVTCSGGFLRGPILKGGSRYAVEVGKNGSLTTTVSLRHIDGDPIESASGHSS